MSKILIVEDEEDIRESLVDILELNDFEVFSAKNGEEGFKIILNDNPHLVLCDINMPIMNGMELLEKVNLEIENKPIFIFLTAKVEAKDKKQGLDLGADEYILKPFDHLEIVERINYHLDNS